jgi:hypothetical protein
MNDTAASRATYTVGITQPVALLAHPFDACIKAARSAGIAEGLASRAQEVQVLVAKLQSFERHIAQLEGRLRGSEMLESEKMEGQLRHLQLMSDAPGWTKPKRYSRSSMPLRRRHYRQL